MYKQGLITNIAKTTSANLFTLVLSAITGFLLPKYLAIPDYARYQTFNFYALFLIALPLGFTGGLYLKYGGVKTRNINKQKLASELLCLLLILSLGTIVLLLLGLARADLLLIAIALFVLPYNFLFCFKQLFQATNELGKYALLQSAESLLIALWCLTFIAFHLQNIMYLIWGRIILAALIMLLLLLSGIRNISTLGRLQPFAKENFYLLSTGFILMLGGFSNLLLRNLDRWFVKIFLSDHDFAYYSFALAMSGVISVLITSVSVTFYPAFARRGIADTSIEKLRKVVLMAGALLCGCFFLFKFIVMSYLAKYTPSLNIIAFFFLAVPVLSVITSVYLNLYMSRKRITRFLVVNISMVVLSLGLNYFALRLNKSTVSICLANTIAFYLWFLYCSRDFTSWRSLRPDLAFLAFFILIFIVTTRFVPIWGLGLALFMIAVAIISFICYKPILISLFQYWQAYLRRKTTPEPS